MAKMADIGVRWIPPRVRVGRHRAPPGRSTAGTRSTAIMEEAAANCLSVLAMVGTTPRWARRSGCATLWCPPRNDAAFAAFVTKVAERYGSQGIEAWEVWNEPNHAAWWEPAPDPGAYGRLLLAAGGRDPVSVDPGATVLSGALAPSPPDNERRMLPDQFLEEVYDSGAMDVVDAVAYHPYSFPDLPSERTGNNGFIDQVGDVRDVMVDHGDGDEKVWLTEFGFATPGDGPALLARQVRDGRRRLRRRGGRSTTSGRSSGSTGATCSPARPIPQQNFGLRRSDDRPKPAYAAFCREIAR